MFIVELGSQSDYSLLGVSADAPAKDIRDSVRNISGDLLRQHQKARTPEEKVRIEEKLKKINDIEGRLMNAERRARYDSQNVHLTFFTVRRSAAPVWGERWLMLQWMHEAIRSSLEARGESVAPLSDLDRTDFTADFTQNELLDQMLRAREQRNSE
jgi:curved DNA-binding protein CbpA